MKTNIENFEFLSGTLNFYFQKLQNLRLIKLCSLGTHSRPICFVFTGHVHTFRWHTEFPAQKRSNLSQTFPIPT